MIDAESEFKNLNPKMFVPPSHCKYAATHPVFAI